MKLLLFIVFALVLLLPSTTVHATEFIYNSTLDEYSIEAKQQMENYCSLSDRPKIPSNDRFYYNNSTHFMSAKYCTWQEIPECIEGTIYAEGSCGAIYLNGPPSHSTGDCLIATASYGSELAPQVQMLREIRDNTLLNTESGKIFMNGFNTIYYSFSPQVAQLENENPIFKEAVKLFITPMITTLSIMTFAQEDSESDVIILGISTIGLIVGMYVVAPIVVIHKLRSK